jgi:hypothetical protein
MTTETNSTTFLPTEGPMKGREIVEHVNTLEHVLPGVGRYVLDHPTATATWEMHKDYDEAIHG